MDDATCVVVTTIDVDEWTPLERKLPLSLQEHVDPKKWDKFCAYADQFTTRWRHHRIGARLVLACVGLYRILLYLSGERARNHMLFHNILPVCVICGVVYDMCTVRSFYEDSMQALCEKMTEEFHQSLSFGFRKVILKVHNAPEYNYYIEVAFGEHASSYVDLESSPHEGGGQLV